MTRRYLCVLWVRERERDMTYEKLCSLEFGEVCNVCILKLNSVMELENGRCSRNTETERTP